MKKNEIIIHDAGDCYFLRVKKDISIHKLQKLCQKITCELVNKCYYDSYTSFAVNEMNIEIVSFIHDDNKELMGFVGFICRQFDDDTDYFEMHPCRNVATDAIFEEWTKEEWCELCNDVEARMLKILCR